jgi:hypothetical protein
MPTTLAGHKARSEKRTMSTGRKVVMGLDQVTGDSIDQSVIEEQANKGSLLTALVDVLRARA